MFSAIPLPCPDHNHSRSLHSYISPATLTVNSSELVTHSASSSVTETDESRLAQLAVSCSLRAPISFIGDGQSLRSVGRPGSDVLCAGESWLELGDGNVLWRLQRGRNNGWRVRVREPVPGGVRDEHGSAELVAVQRRRVVRAVLPDHVQPPGVAVVQERRHGDGHGDQPVPAKLGAPQQQWRLVQPAADALRHGAARVRADRHLQGRHHPRPLPAGEVLQAGRSPFQDRRVQQLRAGDDHERGRERVAAVGVGEGEQDRVDPAEPQLGRQLAVHLLARRAGALLRRHLHRRPDALHLQRRAVLVEVRDVLQQQLPVPVLIRIT